MKTELIAINAKYEHENIAVWCLKEACGRRGIDVSVQQHTINDPMERIWAAIMDDEPDTVGFSCYIWNRPLVERLVSDIKKADPAVVIVVGGPETEYDGSEEDFKSYGADYVLRGEGERRLPALLAKLEKGRMESPTPELTYDCEEKANDFISPVIPEYLSRIGGRIAYVESSRGCPYNCSYCLSSGDGGLRFYPPEKVIADLEALAAAGAKVVKFVDRSFSSNVRHSLEIWERIMTWNPENITFHFEINPDRLTLEQMETLAGMPGGLVQVEAGIQSTNEAALKAVSRVMDTGAALGNLKELVKPGNIHVHADLIAGLPNEDLDSFKKSFNAVYAVRPHNLQLGFLKLLHGTRIRREAVLYGYRFRSYPPYEVISNDAMPYGDILKLKGIEDVLERFYNSGRLRLAMDYILSFFETPFDLYDALRLRIKGQGLLYTPVSAARLYELARGFALSLGGVDRRILESLLSIDYLCSFRTTVVPDSILEGQEEGTGLKILDCREYLDEETLKKVGRNNAFRRFIAAEGLFPVKKGEDFEYGENRIMIDTRAIDPVTGRAKITMI